MLQELDLPGLVILDRRMHVGRRRWFRRIVSHNEHVELQGSDIFWKNTTIDVAMLRRGVSFVMQRWHKRIDGFSEAIACAQPERPRILVIERGDSDPFYLSGRAEKPSSGRDRRSIGNHAELVRALQQRFPGTRNVLLEGVPLAEQIALFHAADVVVAQHGAALANAVWMRPEAAIVEIRPLPKRESWRNHFKFLAASLGIAYMDVRQAADFSPIDVASIVTIVEGMTADAGQSRPAPGVRQSSAPGDGL
jgi:hypothetical protein